MSDSYSGIINAFNTLRLANGAVAREYSDNYKGIIDAITDLRREWGQAQPGEYPPGWGTETDDDGNITGDWIYPPTNGQLWFDERQGRLMVYVDDGFYQANGADVLTAVSNTPPDDEIEGALWYQPNSNSLYLFDGTSWVIVSTTTTSFSPNDLVLDAASRSHIQGTSYQNITDFSASQSADYNVTDLIKWIVTSLSELDTDVETLQNAADINVGSTAPANPIDGDLWYDSSAYCLKVRVGSAWVVAVDLATTTANHSALSTAFTAHETANETRFTSIESSINNLPFSNYATTASLNTAQTTLQTNINSLSTTVGDLNRFSLVSDRNTLINGIDGRVTTLENATIDFSPYATVTALNTAITELHDAITNENYATQSYVTTAIAAIAIPDISGKLDTSTFNTYTASQASQYLAKTGGTITSTLAVDKSDIAIPSVDFSTSTADSQKVFKLKTRTAADKYVTFGGTGYDYEYAWEFSDNEDFCWKHAGNGKQFAITKDGAFAKNLTIADFAVNTSNGMVVLNPIDVKSKLSSHDTSIASMISDISIIKNNQDVTTMNQIYYSDVSPPTTNINDGDLWFDSANLRLNVRHSNAWVFPDRVEDTALKTALYNAVNNSTDYATLKSGLLSALT